MGSESNMLPGSTLDRDALQELFRLHGPAVRAKTEFRIPRRWRSVLSAEDVMQQTYVDAIMDRHAFVPAGEGSFRAWLLALAECNRRDALRMLTAEKRGGRHRRVQSWSGEASMVAFYELVMGKGSTPSQHVARTEALAAMRTTIDTLPDVYRRVVRMHDLEGRPYAGIAKAVGRSEGAVCMIRSRALRLLRAKMGRTSDYLSSA